MLEGRHLSVAFDGRPVLDDVSLAVASGERVQLAAPSGTGKTTLCRVLAGYLAPRTGEVLVDGSPLPRRAPWASSSSPIPRPWPSASPPAWWSCQPFRVPSVDSSWMGACLSCAQAVI